MKRYFPFIPGASTDKTEPSRDLLTFRVQALQTILLITSLYGIIHLNISLKASGTQIEILETAGLLFFTIVSLTLFFFQNLSFNVRSVTLILLCYLQATLLLATSGWGVMPLLLLFIFSILCALSGRNQIIVTGIILDALSVVVWTVLAFQNVVPGAHSLLILEAVLAFFLLPAGTLLLRYLLSDIPRQPGPSTPDTKPLSATTQTLPVAADTNLVTGMLQILSSEKDSLKISQKICDLLKQSLDLYYVGVFHLDNAREYAVLQYGTGDEGLQMLNASYRLSVGGFALVGKAIQSGEIKTCLPDENDPSRFENPFLPNSRCETALPLVCNGETCGALDVHMDRREDLDEARLQILQQAAYTLSISMEKARTDRFIPIQLPSSTSSFSTLSSGPAIREFEAEYINPSVDAQPGGGKVEIPLALRHEKVGVLELNTNGRELSAQEKNFIRDVTTHALNVIENACKIERINRQAELERMVFEISSKLHATNDSKQMLQIALQEISRNLGVSKAQIVLNVPESPRPAAKETTETRSLAKGPTTGPLSER